MYVCMLYVCCMYVYMGTVMSPPTMFPNRSLLLFIFFFILFHVSLVKVNTRGIQL